MLDEPRSVGDALAYLTAFTPERWEHVCDRLDRRWIEEALAATGTATLRRRRLPAEQVIWLVLGMAMMRDRPIVDIVDRLDLALPTPRGELMAASGVSQARTRLGAAPMEWLFVRASDEWGHASARAHDWRNLAVYAVDGSTMRVPDSPENRDVFGSQPSRHGSDSSYPLIRIVTLMAVRSHVIAAASFGPYDNELRYAEDLWTSVPSDAVVILDRGFWSSRILIPLMRDRPNRHFLIRALSATRLHVVERLGRDDELVEIEVNRGARAIDPTLPRTMTLRAIRYQRRGFRPQTLLTSLLDAKAFPRDEIVALYHDRWEIELGYDELKTEMLAREEAIRSKSPEMVRQELWGLLLAYNLVRLEMERFAATVDVDPRRLSFVGFLRLICDQWQWLAVTRTPGSIPRQLANMRATCKRLVLPERRSRSYPRVVKIKMASYDRKRPPSDKGAK